MEERRFIGESHPPGKDPQILDGGDEVVLDTLTSEEWMSKLQRLVIKHIRRQRQFAVQHTAVKRLAVADSGSRHHDDQTALRQCLDVVFLDEPLGLGCERQHGCEDLRVAHQPLQEMLAPRPRPVEAGLVGKRIPHADIGTEKVAKAGIAAADIACADDADPLAFQCAVGKGRVIAELMSTLARFANAMRLAILPVVKRGDDAMMRLRCLTRYDTAHGYPHQDILDKDENALAKIVIPTDDLDEAFHHAINDLKTHASRYLKTFGQD